MPALLLPALLRLVSRPHLAAHRLRTALTVIGVALGVAAVIGIADASRSVLASFEHMVRTVAGDCELEVTSAAGLLDDDLVEQVAAQRGVKAAAALIETFVPLADEPTRSVYLLGIDFLRSPVWSAQFPRQAIDLEDELAFLNQLDSALVPRTFAERAHLALGDALRIVGPSGPRTLRVRGFLDDVAASRLFDGALVVMDLPAAELLLGRPGHADRVLVELAPGYTVADVRARLAGALGPAFDVAAPEGRGEQTEKLLFCLRAMLACQSLSAVIVGALIVYHTVAASIRQRRRQFALLNLVGLSRATLGRLCMVETLALAAVGVAVGLGAGRWLGVVAGTLVGEAVSGIWVRVDATQHVVSGAGTALGVVLGLGVALFAASLAIRSTFTVPAIEALRRAEPGRDGAGRSGRLVVLAVVVVAATWLIAFAPPGLGLVPTVALIEGTHAMTFGALAAAAPALVAVAGLVATWLAGRVTAVAPRLAAQNMRRSASRGGATVATTGAAIGIAVALAGVVASFEGAWIGWIEQHFTADLFVGGGGRVRLLAGPPMGDTVREAVAGIPGIASVEAVRAFRIRVADRAVVLEGLSVADRLARGGLPMVEGDLRDAAPALEAGTGVLLSDHLAYRLGLHRGDHLDVPTPAGTRRFRIEGTFVDYLASLDLGAVAVDRAVLATLWGDSSANLFRVWLRPGVSATAAREAIAARLGGGAGYYVLDARQFVDAVRGAIGQFFLAAWALVLVAACVGVVGVVNAQLAAVLDRRSELATLRTIGVSAASLTRSVVLECGLLGAIGGLAGAAVGCMLAAQMVVVTLRLMTGWRIPFALPVAPATAAVGLAMVVSAAAGWVPARAATSVPTAVAGED